MDRQTPVLRAASLPWLAALWLVLPVPGLAVELATAPASGEPSPGTPAAGMERLMSSRGCELTWQRFDAPAATPAEGPVVLIAHGTLRNSNHMEGWARALAEGARLTAVALDQCAGSAPGGRPADDGADLVALRKHLGFEHAIYVGVSAGGLAALTAASMDPDATRGLLLLDPVNAGGQARRAAGRVRAPVAALVAKPQACNAWRNIDRALRALSDATIVDLGRVSHCDFEWPTDTFCRVACLSTGDSSRNERSMAAIRAIGVGFIAAIARQDHHALAHWKGDIGALLP